MSVHSIIVCFRKSGGRLIGFLKKMKTELFKTKKLPVENEGGKSKLLKMDQNATRRKKRSNSESDNCNNKKMKPCNSTGTKEVVHQQNGNEMKESRTNDDLHADAKRTEIKARTDKG